MGMDTTRITLDRGSRPLLFEPDRRPASSFASRQSASPQNLHARPATPVKLVDPQGRVEMRGWSGCVPWRTPVPWTTEEDATLHKNPIGAS
jgi:hypothetical protein